MSESPTTRRELTPQVQRAIRMWIAQATLGLLGYGLLLFLAAGRLDWLWGWVFLGEGAAVLAAHPLILIPIDPELLAERERGLRDERVPRSDRWVTMLAAGLFPMAGWVVAGLDVRFGWTAPLSPACHLLGLLVTVLGYALFLWAMASNAYFAEGVRIQEERGHTVATAGPYRYVRHPGYVGAILAQLGTPWLLGSPWAFLAGIASAGLYVLRTHLEDKTLRAELPGYSDYAQATRYRLLPGVW